MSSPRNRKTPGVYITELDAFPPSIVGVPTAVPGFVGYTDKADLNGRDVTKVPIKISSLVDYETIFGRGPETTYTIDSTTATPDDHDFSVDIYTLGDDEGKKSKTQGATQYYKLKPTTDKRFCLFDSMRLFFANGGGNCYVVSVGNYDDAVKEGPLSKGLDAIENQSGPTMLVVPDATLLPWKSRASGSDYQKVAQKMLGQAAKLQDRIAILDVYGADMIGTPQKLGEVEGKVLNLDDIAEYFRTAVGDEGLNYGAAYFPFVKATVKPATEVNYTHTNITKLADAAPEGVTFTEGLTTLLQQILEWQNVGLNFVDNTADGGSRYTKMLAQIKNMATAKTSEEIQTLADTLSSSLPVMNEINEAVLTAEAVLPPSAAIAGIYTTNDNERGVWNAPANVVVGSVSGLTYSVKGDQQDDLNVPIDGKAIDAIREFVGRGPVVWGARTLDGNSPDYRYIQVRRTLIYIEQSVKLALDPFVFAANDGKTWSTVVSMVSGFLNGLWSQGGLLGSKPDEAFTVACGLGSTMTGQDILDGYMIVRITLQMIRPAEFIELTFKQKMDGVAAPP